MLYTKDALEAAPMEQKNATYQSHKWEWLPHTLIETGLEQNVLLLCLKKEITCGFFP